MNFSRQHPISSSRQTKLIATFQRVVQWSAAILNGVVAVCLIYLVIQVRKGGLTQHPQTMEMILKGAIILVCLSFIHFLVEGVLTKKWLHAKGADNLDPLTGGMNRTCFDEVMEEEIRRSSRYHAPLSLCCLDLDSFQSYNESYGKDKGDQLLRQFSELMRGTVRFTDSVARYENDEFCVLLPHTDLVRAEKFVNRALAQSQERIDYSFCAGLTSYKAGESRAHFLMRAKHALQHAKSEGKKRVRCIIGDDDSQTLVNF